MIWFPSDAPPLSCSNYISFFSNAIGDSPHGKVKQNMWQFEPCFEGLCRIITILFISSVVNFSWMELLLLNYSRASKEAASCIAFYQIMEMHVVQRSYKHIAPFITEGFEVIYCCIPKDQQRHWCAKHRFLFPIICRKCLNKLNIAKHSHSLPN